MTTPDDDWQKRIEAGLPFHPTADERAAGLPDTDGRTTEYPTADHPTADHPTAEYPAEYPAAGYPATGYPQAPGPVFGAPGSGPAYPSSGTPPPGFPAPGFTPPGYPAPDPATTQQFAAVPGYGYAGGDAGAPFGRDPLTGEPMSDKSKVTAGLLQMLLPFLGVCGIGRLYIGSTAIGLVQLLGFWFGFLAMLLLVGFLIVPAVWLWSFIDGILMLAGNVRDAQGRKLRD